MGCGPVHKKEDKDTVGNGKRYLHDVVFTYSADYLTKFLKLLKSNLTLKNYFRKIKLRT